MLRIGKHKGESFEVVQNDRSYVSWILRENPRGFTKFARIVKDRHGGILDVGRHKGAFFDEVLRDDPDYCEWALTLTEPGEPFKKFLEYLRIYFVHEEPQKKQKTGNVCKICYDRDMNTVFYPCGHIVACTACASKLEIEGHCPICKELIFIVVKTYVA